MLEAEDGAVPATPVVMGVVDEVAVEEAVVVEAEVEAVEGMTTTTTMTKTPPLRP